MIAEWTQAATRFDSLHVMYVQADRKDVPRARYTPEIKDNHIHWRGNWPLVGGMWAADSQIWLEFFSTPEAKASYQTYSDLCVQALMWERSAFPRLSPATSSRNPVLTWTLGLFELAWNHPSVSAPPMIRNGVATMSPVNVERAVRLKLPRLEYGLFMNFPMPLPGFFRILQPDCFRASAWRMRRILECCTEGPSLTVAAPPTDKPNDHISQRAAAQEIGVDASTIGRWIKAGFLPASGPKGRRRVSRAFLLANHESIQQRIHLGKSVGNSAR